MADFLAEKRTEIERRLEELRPLGEEFARLERAKAALEGLDGEGAASPQGARRGRRARAGAGASGGGRAGGRSAGDGRRRRSGGRAGEALELVRQNPGITVSEIADRLGMKQRNYLYRIMTSLEGEGAVDRQGRGFVAR